MALTLTQNKITLNDLIEHNTFKAILSEYSIGTVSVYLDVLQIMGITEICDGVVAMCSDYEDTCETTYIRDLAEEVCEFIKGDNYVF